MVARKRSALGEKVEVNIQADYYFGGPVANANVEVLVYQNPFYHYWHRPRDYPWFYEDMDSRHISAGPLLGGGGQIIKRETLKTDATGKATLTFDTPRNCRAGFRISHRSARHRFQPPRNHRQRHRARHAPALLRLSRGRAQPLSPAGQGDRRFQSARRQRATGADRRHGQGHARLLV